MKKLRFDFEVKPGSDAKTNVICITSIATSEGQVFEIPPEYQPAGLHTEITTTSNYAKVRKSLNKRHQTRKIWITLTEALEKVYMDEDENLQFNEIYLEEITNKLAVEPTPSGSGHTIEQLLHALLDEKTTNPEKRKTIGAIASDFMLEKFTGRNSNANQWIDEFNSECDRLQVNENEHKIKLLKLFLENAGMEWYNCMLIKNSLLSEWNAWEENFRNTFANKGWSPVRYAFAFKYQAGSLLEYALKKEKLLLEVRKSIDTGTLIDLIAFGLPNFVSDKIDRGVLTGTETLYKEIGKLEHLVGKSKYERINVNSKNFIEKKPCRICINEKKGKRFHPEDNCWFKAKSQNSVKRTVNNSELEVELNKTDQKN